MDTTQVINALVRVATVLSPSHGHAVAKYLMEYIGQPVDSKVLNDTIIRVALALIAEFDVGVEAMSNMGGEMIFCPMLTDSDDPISKAQREYRANTERAFGSLRFEGLSFVADNSDDDFWPDF